VSTLDDAHEDSYGHRGALGGLRGDIADLVVPASLSGYGTGWDRLTLGGVTVPHLLLIDATLGAVAIMLAAWIVLRRWWSDRRSQRQGEVAWLAGEGTAPGEMTVVPGLSEGEADPDPGAREPAGFDRAPPQVSDVDGADSGADEPEPGADEPEPGADEPEPGADEPPRPQQPPAQLNGAGPGAHAPAAKPGGPPGTDGTVTSRGRVSSYYEGADQQMADYLAELGWSEESESGARDGG